MAQCLLGRPKGPDSGAEVSLGVVRCHLGGPEGGTRYCGWAKPPHFFRGAGIAPGGPGRLGHETRQGAMQPVRTVPNHLSDQRPLHVRVHAPLYGRALRIEL